MNEIITRTGIFSLRNMLTYRVIGSTITEKIREHLLDLQFISPVINNSNIHCISCITYDIFSSSMLLYVLSFHISGELNTMKRLEKYQKLGNMRTFLSKTLWILVFVLTKNIENAI
jgi:hypothetical protein